MRKWLQIVTGVRVSTVIILFFLEGCSGIKSKNSESYTAGFIAIHSVDKSRIYKPNTDTAHYLHYRPIDLDVWYPADSSANDTPLVVYDFLRLLEHRGNYYSASNIGSGVAGQLAHYFCDVFKCSDSTRLLDFRSNSFKNTSPVSGRFPLVIYMTAFNGMSYENFVMFESLAKRGFVVASISSIGRFPGDMTMKKEDLMEQVFDAVAALNILAQNPTIDLNKIGIVGYSWGGLAAVLLADKLPTAKCLVSLEGSEFHHYGSAKDENADFDTIRNSNEFNNIHLSIPYLRLESSPLGQTEKVDSVYNFSLHHVNNAQIFAIDSMQHGDFDCFSLIVPKSGNCPVNQGYNSSLKLIVGFLESHLKNQNSFSKIVQQQINKTIKMK